MKNEAKSIVDDILSSISQTTLQNSVQDESISAQNCVRETGRATSNMLLSAIHSNSVDHTRILVSLRHSLDNLSENIAKQNSTMQELLQVQQKQLIIASSTYASKDSVKGDTLYNDSSDKGEYYYNGTKIIGKHQIMACLLSHIMQMGISKMRSMGNYYYPDSINCSFGELSIAVRMAMASSTILPNYSYGGEINVPDKKRPVMVRLLPLICTKNVGVTPDLMADNLASVWNNNTIDEIFVPLGHIMERLVKLDGYLSPTQLDILKSIGRPICIQDDDSDKIRLNIDEKKWKQGFSHPLSVSVGKLKSGKKTNYIKLILAGSTPQESYEQSKE